LLIVRQNKSVGSQNMVATPSYREAVLDMFVFQSLSQVSEQTEKWLREYNEERPHESLGNQRFTVTVARTFVGTPARG
jgi:putative transposase